MKLVFLASTATDLDWFKRYYIRVFPQGAVKARERYQHTKRLLREQPFSGEVISDTELRELHIARTPFSFIYRVTKDQIEIVHVWDGRSERPQGWNQ